MSQGTQEKLTKEVSQIWLQICLIVFHNILTLHKALLILQELETFSEVLFSALHNLGFCRSTPLLCLFNSHICPESVRGRDQAAPVENNNMGLALRGKDTQIFCSQLILAFGKGKSLILLTSSVHSSNALHELVFNKQNYILHIFLLVLVGFLDEEWAVDLACRMCSPLPTQQITPGDRGWKVTCDRSSSRSGFG